MQQEGKATTNNFIPIINLFKKLKNIINSAIDTLVALIVKMKISANIITILGFIIGMFAVNFLSYERYSYALICIIINRFFDIIDGRVARKATPTKFGIFLDYILDYIFYAAVIFGFALARIDQNALYASLLLFAFLTSAITNFVYAIVANKNKEMSKEKTPFYMKASYQVGEIFIAIIIACIIPQYFYIIASVAAVIAIIKTFSTFTVAFYQLIILDRKK